MPTFGEWEATVLRHCYDVVDYVSLHAYYEQHGDDVASFLASGHAMDRFIDGVIADHIRAVTKSRKKIQLSFDEWNVWYASRFAGHTNLEWEEAPRLIEDTYSTLDAVVVGNLLMSLLRHADRVGFACLAQLVNVTGPIRAEPGRQAWRQTTFHPFALTSRTSSRNVTSHQRMGGGSHGLAATNTVDTPDRVTAVELRDSATVLTDDGVSVALEPVSWNLIRLSHAAGLA